MGLTFSMECVPCIWARVRVALEFRTLVALEKPLEWPWTASAGYNHLSRPPRCIGWVKSLFSYFIRPPPASFPQYAKLPTELRLMIIREAIKDPAATKVGHLATVDSEWQEVVEKKTFRTLTFTNEFTKVENWKFADLNPRVLDELERYIVGNRGRFVQRLAFRKTGPIGRGSIHLATLQRLFGILATWSNSDERTHSLALDFQNTHIQHTSQLVSSAGKSNASNVTDDWAKLVDVTSCSLFRPRISFTPLWSLLPHLRCLHMHYSEDIIATGRGAFPAYTPILPDDLIQPRIKEFYQGLAAAAPQLAELVVISRSLDGRRYQRDIDSRTRRIHWLFEPVFITETLQYAKTLSKLEMRISPYDIPDFKDTFDEFTDKSFRTTPGNVWPNLTHLSLSYLVPSCKPCLQNGVEVLFKASCFAMGCMPEIRKFYVAVGWDNPYVFETTTHGSGTTTDPRRSQLQFEPKGCGWPSREALNTWKANMDKLKLGSQDIDDLEAQTQGTWRRKKEVAWAGAQDIHRLHRNESYEI